MEIVSYQETNGDFYYKILENNRVIATRGQIEEGKYLFDDFSCFDVEGLFGMTGLCGQYFEFTLYGERIIENDLFKLIRIKIENDKIDFHFGVFGNEILKETSYHPITIFKSLKKEISSTKFEVIEESYFPDSVEESHIAISYKKEFTGLIKSYSSELDVEIHRLIEKIDYKKLDWNSEFEANEAKFSNNFLEPLFRKMGFESVRYNHGPHEYGKDFILSQIDLFGRHKFIGVQVKCGNLNGNMKSQINEIFEQINDAFTDEFFSLETNRNEYISEMLIIISGYFTHNARKKIKDKIKFSYQGRLGNVNFLDKDGCISLLNKYS